MFEGLEEDIIADATKNAIRDSLAKEAAGNTGFPKDINISLPNGEKDIIPSPKGFYTVGYTPAELGGTLQEAGDDAEIIPWAAERAKVGRDSLVPKSEDLYTKEHYLEALKNHSDLGKKLAPLLQNHFNKNEGPAINLYNDFINDILRVHTEAGKADPREYFTSGTRPNLMRTPYELARSAEEWGGLLSNG